jgi:hypothetical protein
MPRLVPVVLPAAALVLCAPLVARAQDVTLESQPTPTERSVQAGSFLSLSHAATLDTQRAFATAVGGYDGGRSTALFEATAEVNLWGPIAVRVGSVLTTADERLRPSFGARVQVFQQGLHGLDGSAGLFYRPEGLTEPEGEIELILAAGRRLGPAYLLGNIAYGQDPEARERDGEVRLAALFAATSSLQLGLDSRLRFDLGSDAELRASKGEPKLDLLAGPCASLVVARFALLAHGGASVFRTTASTKYGAFVLGGLATAF